MNRKQIEHLNETFAKKLGEAESVDKAMLFAQSCTVTALHEIAAQLAELNEKIALFYEYR